MQPDTVIDLADAMRKNPKLKVFSANGWFDLATPFFGTEHDLAQMMLPPGIAGECVVWILSGGAYGVSECGCAEGDACGFGGVVSDGGEVGSVWG